jgi:acylglycerol lipase
MDLSFTLRFRPPNPPLSRRKLESPIIHPLKRFLPTFHRPDIKPNAKPFPMSSRTHQSTVVTAKLNKPIDGVSEELNLIASQNLDHAPARRRVRSAFVQVQQELDHPLFKVCFLDLITIVVPVLISWIYMDSDRCYLFWVFIGG